MTQQALSTFFLSRVTLHTNIQIKDSRFQSATKFASGIALKVTLAAFAVFETITYLILLTAALPMKLFAPKFFFNLTNQTRSSVNTIFAAVKALTHIRAHQLRSSSKKDKPSETQSTQLKDAIVYAQDKAIKYTIFIKKHKAATIAIVVGAISATVLYYNLSSIVCQKAPTSTARVVRKLQTPISTALTIYKPPSVRHTPPFSLEVSTSFSRVVRMLQTPISTALTVCKFPSVRPIPPFSLEASTSTARFVRMLPSVRHKLFFCPAAPPMKDFNLGQSTTAFDKLAIGNHKIENPSTPNQTFSYNTSHSDEMPLAPPSQKDITKLGLIASLSVLGIFYKLFYKMEYIFSPKWLNSLPPSELQEYEMEESPAESTEQQVHIDIARKLSDTEENQIFEFYIGRFYETDQPGVYPTFSECAAHYNDKIKEINKEDIHRTDAMEIVRRVYRKRLNIDLAKHCKDTGLNEAEINKRTATIKRILENNKP